MTYVNVSLTWPVAMKHDWDKQKKALTQEKELTSHAGIVWFATSVIGLGRQSTATVVLFKCKCLVDCFL